MRFHCRVRAVISKRSCESSIQSLRFINIKIFIFFKANLLKVLTKDFGNDFDELLPGMFARRNLHDAKLLNEAVKVPN